MDSSIFHRFSSHLELNRRVVRLLQLTLRGGDVRHHATGEGRRRGDPRSGGAGLASRSPAAKPWGDHGKIIGKKIYIYIWEKIWGNIWDHHPTFWENVQCFL